MKRLILVLVSVLLGMTAMAQEQASRTMRVFYGGQVVYMRDVAQMDSINFLLNGNGGNGHDPDAADYVETAFGMQLEMVYVAGGTFQMGRTPEQEDADQWDDELPVHSVTLSDYYIGKFEVTQAQWKAVMGTNPSYFKGDDLPVDSVSWNEVVQFCEKLSTLTGKKYTVCRRRPSGEYAARGGRNADGTKYAGSDRIGGVAWYYNNSGYRTHAVGTKSPNGLGLYDMSGNVWEWCSDWYGESYYGSSPALNPQGPSGGSSRVLRGGCWRHYATCCRVSYRNYYDPGYRGIYLGFRVVCEL